MKDYGKGYREQMRIAERFVVISWDNGSDKFCVFRFDIETGNWIRTTGNYEKRLPKWVQEAAA